VPVLVLVQTDGCGPLEPVMYRHIVSPDVADAAERKYDAALAAKAAAVAAYCVVMTSSRSR
jgi:hypothetical protein